MPSELDRVFSVHQAALTLRGHRSQVLASNIANADTPGYKARDVDFKSVLAEASGVQSLVRTSPRHLPIGATSPNGNSGELVYRTVAQASIDNNTVDVNVERAQFADNAMRYEASLTFINAKIKSLLTALQS
jgi:flagellar basal-body rod protein FlgB